MKVLSIKDKMNKIVKYILFPVLVFISMQNTESFALIPDEYYTNYEVEKHWETISDSMIKIKAATNIGEEPSTVMFKLLHDNLIPVFKRFPQESKFQVTYEQCLSITENLSHGFSQTMYQIYQNRCENPLNSIVSTINSQYTVRANASASPSSGPAPLTVTLDARNSTDPSNETIPQNNYYRYYRDINGIDRTIGIGNLLSYTFDEPWNYIVHMTVKSSNKNQGIMDWGRDLKISVQPKTTNIIVYANEIKLKKKEYNKIGTQEAKKGIIFDASTTTVKAWREIKKTIWNIVGKNSSFHYRKEYENKPGNINVPLTEEWSYEITVTTVDNEKNSVSETFQMIVSDPVAKIKQTPEVGTTSSIYKFDGSTSYSLTSRLKLYTWEIFDANGNKISTAQGKILTKQFVQPWDYLVRLTIEDEVGKVNVETKQITVSSSAPIPQFTINSTKRREKSSEFILNAENSTDVDVENKNDSLEYQRDFADPENAKIIGTESNNQKIVVQFNRVWTHKVTLTVTDNYGVSSTITKEIVVKSILRPELNLSTNATTWNKTIQFQVKSNEKVIRYEWDFGDGDVKTNEIAEFTHIYKKAWVYNVKITVTDKNEEKNSITERIFIGEDNQPIPAYRVKINNIYIQTEGKICTGEDGNPVDVYQIERYQTVFIDPSISVNTKGTNVWLNFYFQEKDNQIQKVGSYNFKSNELGCRFVDLTLEDTNIGKQKKERIWFKVINALPTLNNLTISFPQYNNESGIGFQQNNIQNIYDNATSDNLIVKVTAQNPRDPDGNISRYFWYYYPKDNPSKILETRSTPWDINYSFFTVARIPWEYMFGVKLYDNDEAQQKSEDIIGNGPTVFFPPTNNNPDIPLVTLKSDLQSIHVGDTVQFDVVAKVLSENKDFYSDRIIYYDFDGDGTWDLTTKKDRVTYVYEKPNESWYHPRAAVEYKGFKWVSAGNDIIVKAGLKPIITYNTIGNSVFIRDLSIWDIKERYICFEKSECEKGNKSFRKIHYDQEIANNQILEYKYDNYGTHVVTIQEKSKQGLEVAKEYEIITTKKTKNGRITSGVNMITIPEISIDQEKNVSIFVNKEQNNKVAFYVQYMGTGACFIDTDISYDSDFNGKTNDDKDILCGKLVFRDYGDKKFGNTIGRLYFAVDGKLTFKSFTVETESEEIPLEWDKLEVYNNISTLIHGIEEKNIWNANLKVLLDKLRKNLLDKNATSATVVEIQTWIDTNLIMIDENQEFLLESVLNTLSNADTVAALWGNEYEQAKTEILSILPDELAKSVEIKFLSFENMSDKYDNDEKKEQLNEILNFIIEKSTEYEIDPNDINYIVKHFCKILNFYSIVSNKCSTLSQDVQPVQQDESWTVQEETESTWLPTWLKILLGIVIGAIVIVGGVIVFFAVKAKMKDETTEEEEE